MITYLSILKVALDQPVIDVGICSTLGKQGFQEDVGGDKELLLLVDELECAVTITQVVKRNRLSKHIVSHAPHLHGVWREEFTSVDEAASRECHWVVPLVHDEHTNDSFITINDKVSTKLMHVLLPLDQLFLTQPTQVAILGANHHGNLTNANVDLLSVFIVDSSAKSSIKWCLVSQ